MFNRLFFYIYRSFNFVISFFNTILLTVVLVVLLLIELNSICTLLILVFLYYILNLFVNSTTGFTYFFDWISRVDINDSFINLFNFFWTTFFYLPSFFFFVLQLLIFLTSIKSTRISYLYFTVCYILYNVEIVDFIIINLNSELTDLNITSVNQLLTNNLNKYHPFIFYLSVFLTFNSILILIRNLYTNLTFISNGTTKNFLQTIKYILLLNLTALFLGSWWALQEGTWGGWWNWDPSEVLGLLFTFVSLLHIHSMVSPSLICLNIYRLLFTVLFTVFSYVFIQLNFDLVSHNFGSKFFFFFNNNLFFIEVITVLFIYTFTKFNLILVTISNYNSLLLSTNWLKNKNLYNHWIWIFLIYFLMLLVIFNSFIPLINYFIWTYFHINSFNFSTTTYHSIILLLILLLTPFKTNYQYYNIFFYMLLIFYSNSLTTFLMILLTLRFKLVLILHLSLIILITINIMSYNLQFIYWYTYSEPEGTLFNSKIFSKLYDIHTCNNFFIEQVNFSSISSTNNFNTWNIFYDSNSINLNSFNLVFNNSTFVNFYNLSSNWLNSILLIETNYLNNLLETICIFFYIYCLLVLINNNFFKPTSNLV